MSHLSSVQRSALEQLQTVVHGADEDVAITVLDSVGWDVQRAVDLIFDSSPPSNSMQPFDEIDDSHVRPPPRTPSLYQQLSRIITFPLHILSSLLRFLLALLRLPVRFTTFSFYTPRPRPRPRSGADRWVRELEEETGAISISSSTTALAASTASTSGLTHRAGLPDDTKLLPDFTLGTYEDALRTMQRESRVGCIVLVSEEHDDVPEFKRTTLTDPEFVRILTDNNIVVWGGDVRDPEAYSAAEKLQATTYPFIAFLSLQPRRAPSSASRPTTTSTTSTQKPTLTVLSRHAGPSTSSSAPTSPATLTTHLQTQLLPRVLPFLSRLRSTQEALERDRALRDEQDAAFHATAARDRERIEGLMAADREAAERALAERELASRRAEEEQRAKEALERIKETRFAWRKWFFSLFQNTPEPLTGTRIAIRFPTGSRLIRTFPSSDSLTHLYSFVAGHLSPPSSPSTVPQISPAGDAPSSPLEAALLPHLSAGAQEWWGFLLVSSYPRAPLPWKAETRLGDVEALKGGGQLVVEVLGERASASASASRERGVGDDGYETESDEE
ncbi:hypothetical protein DXG01_004535 [Tephrocybe rancida]|nr:hypothetical protein DXG01_004535 [Tephrocybe rancida]